MHIFLPWTTQILHRTAKISFVCEASRTYLMSAAGNYCWWIKPTALRDRGLAERAARAERRQNIRDLPKTIRGLRPPIKLQKNCPGTKKNCLSGQSRHVPGQNQLRILQSEASIPTSHQLRTSLKPRWINIAPAIPPHPTQLAARQNTQHTNTPNTPHHTNKTTTPTTHGNHHKQLAAHVIQLVWEVV